MKEIRFTEPLFHKVVNGTKTQTRRIIKMPMDRVAITGSNYYKAWYFVDKNGFTKEPVKSRYSVNEVVYLTDHNHQFYYYVKITGVGCATLQGISDADCVKEGITINPAYDNDVRDEKILVASSHYIAAYADLIDEIYGKGTWESNPYVWVYDFELIKK